MWGGCSPGHPCGGVGLTQNDRLGRNFVEKRLVFFLMLSFLVMLGYTQLMTIVAPERFGPREGDKPAAQVDRPEREEWQDGELAVPDRAPDEKWGVPDDDKGAERDEIRTRRRFGSPVAR